MYYLQAFLFGITVAIAIGPIALLIMQIALSHGFRAGALAAAGAAAADFLYALVAFGIGASVVDNLQAYSGRIEIAASILLLILAVYLLTQVYRRHGKSVEQAKATGPFTVFLLTASNPLTIVMFVAFAGQVMPAGGPVMVVGMATATFLGSLLVQLGLSAGGAVLGKAISNPRIINGLNILSAFGIGAFGVGGLIVYS
ncbi:MAG: LysE family transporter [Gammaproteobacteria bacterium]